MSLESITKLIFLSLAILAIIILTSIYNINQFQTENLEMDVIFNKILYSPDAISYVEPQTGRAQLGIVDPKKINESILNKAIAYPNEKSYSAKITLTGQGFVKAGYLQKEWFERFAPVARAGTKGVGGMDYIKKEFAITYFSGQDYRRGKLMIEIISPRR